MTAEELVEQQTTALNEERERRMAEVMAATRPDWGVS